MRGFYHRCRKLMAMVLCVSMLTAMMPSGALAGRSLYMPNQLTVVEAEAFENDKSMDELFLAEGVKRIESRAFAGTGLTFVVLPASLTFIADDAFDSCAEDIFFCVVKGSYAEEWCGRSGKDYYSIDSSSAVCTLADLPDQSMTGAEGTAEVNLHDTDACTVSLVDETVTWLKAAVNGQKAELTVEINNSGAVRTAQVAVRCAHGNTRLISVTQAACEAPTLQVTCDGKAVSDGGKLDKLNAHTAAQLNFTFATTHAASMTVTMTDGKDQPVSGVGYTGAVMNEWKLALPDGLAEDTYKITVTVSDGKDADDGLPHTAAVSMTMTVLDADHCPIAALPAAVTLSAKEDTQSLQLAGDQVTSASWADQGKTEEAAKWLTVTYSEDSVTFAARENYALEARSQDVQLTCAHGLTKTLTVTQQASADPAIALTVSYGGEEVAPGETVFRVNNGKSREMTIDLKGNEAVRSLTVALVDGDIKPVQVEGLPYTGKAMEALTFTVPEGIACGNYKLVIVADSSTVAGDQWRQTMTYTGVVSIGQAPVPYDDMSKEYKSSIYYERLMDVTLTGDKAYDMIQIAKSQLGYHEGALNGDSDKTNDCTEYCRWLGHNFTAWCAAFVSWCAYLANVNSIHPNLQAAPGRLFTSAADGHVYSFRSYAEVKQSASTPITFMNDANRCTYVKRGEFIPQRGDLVIFSNNRYALAHIGVVDYYADGVVYYYDGNGDKSEKVKYNSMELDNTTVCMYMRPNFDR